MPSPNKAHKTTGFLQAYSDHLSQYYNNNISLLEIGVQGGDSLLLWKELLPDAQITGLDILPSCKQYEGNGIAVVIGDQTDISLLNSLGSFDIVIDDGGHTMNQQQVAFKTLFPKLNKGGLYVIEDLHTSFWPDFLDSNVKTTDYLKELTDTLHEDANNQRLEGTIMEPNTLGITSIHFYPSICFIYKK